MPSQLLLEPGTATSAARSAWPRPAPPHSPRRPAPGPFALSAPRPCVSAAIPPLDARGLAVSEPTRRTARGGGQHKAAADEEAEAEV